MSATHMRVRFDRAELEREAAGRCRVVVTLSHAGRTIQASASESDQGVGPLKAAAVATLKAIEEAVGGRLTCSLADLDHVNALGRDMIAVLVNIEFEGKQAQLFGSCQIADDEINAAVKATLNATNRFVELATRDRL
jgi:hypothetical protein